MFDKIIPALIAAIVSYIVTVLKAKYDATRWNSEFAANYSKLLVENPKAAEQLAKQFSIGLIIIRDQDGNTVSKHYLPYQCKMSIGRRTENDIVLTGRFVSRDHGIFFYRGNKIMFRLLSPKNKSLLNGKQINKICSLKSGDKIILGETKIEFEELR